MDCENIDYVLLREIAARVPEVARVFRNPTGVNQQALNPQTVNHNFPLDFVVPSHFPHSGEDQTYPRSSFGPLLNPAIQYCPPAHFPVAMPPFQQGLATQLPPTIHQVGPVTFQQGHGGSVNFLLPGFHHTQPSQSFEATLPDHRNVTNDLGTCDDFTNEAGMISSAEFSIDFVADLLNLGFKVSEISRLFDVNERALRYQLEKNNIPAKRRQDMTDQELDSRVALIVEKYPNSGHKMMIGHFTSSRGHPSVTRRRLRESLNRVRVERNARPRMEAFKRRVYSVKGPLSMLHIDGHHKLIRWCSVVHGGIDGYSRMITFLGLSTNNRAITVLDHFLEGVLTHGLPVAVRSDHGLENVGVADMMFAARENEVHNPFITGKSTHNQRIERLWRDVFAGCLEPYYTKFYELERDGHLNPAQSNDIYALHVVVKNLLEGTVSGFKDGWNNHPIRTAGNYTPNKLFKSGLLKMRLEGGYHPELNQDKENIEYAAREAYIMREFNAAGQRKPLVEVPSHRTPLTVQEEAFLHANFDPSTVTLSNLREQYLLVKNWIIQTIQNR